jgi:shikimate dehydrogenase
MSEFLRLAVIGHPVTHSLSPVIHGHWLQQYGLAGSYERVDIPLSGDFALELRRMAEQGFAGFNITLPYKQTSITACDAVDDLARAVGAVNTVFVQEGRLHGTNTDVFGFSENMRKQAPDFVADLPAALVLGAGGAARAAVHALLQQNCSKIFVASRSIKNAETLRDHSVLPERVISIEWPECSKILPEVRLLVNTTPLGMAGQPPLDLSLAHMPENAAVYDIVYAPLETELLRQARARKLTAIDGLGMLLHQARPAFQAWTGIWPDIDDTLRQKVLT